MNDSRNPFQITEDMVHSDSPYKSEHVGKWDWYDETWQVNGIPHETRESAKEQLDRYCKEVLGS